MIIPLSKQLLNNFFSLDQLINRSNAAAQLCTQPDCVQLFPPLCIEVHVPLASVSDRCVYLAFIPAIFPMFSSTRLRHFVLFFDLCIELWLFWVLLYAHFGLISQVFFFFFYPWLPLVCRFFLHPVLLSSPTLFSQFYRPTYDTKHYTCLTQE